MDFKTTIAFFINVEESTLEDAKRSFDVLVDYLKKRESTLGQSNGLSQDKILTYSEIIQELKNIQEKLSNCELYEDGIINIENLGLSTTQIIDLDEGEIEFSESFCTSEYYDNFVLYINNEEWYASELDFSDRPKEGIWAIELNDIDGSYCEY